MRAGDLGPNGDKDLVLGGSGKKQASVAAAALLAVASSGQAAGELMAKYEELQGMYDKLYKRCDELEKKNNKLLAYRREARPESS